LLNVVIALLDETTATTSPAAALAEKTNTMATAAASTGTEKIISGALTR
jgi:hypothetical protein